MRVVGTAVSLLLCIGVRHAAADICVNDRLKVSEVRGRVVAAWRGGVSPVPNASVKLREYRNDEWRAKSKVTTGENGGFVFGNVPPGEYEIYVAASAFRGFGARVRVKSKSRPDSSREIVVNLEPVGCGLAVVRKVDNPR